MKNKIIDLIEPNVEGLSREDIASLIEIPPKPEILHFLASVSQKQCAKPHR